MWQLNYLDESPVFEKERRFAAAFTKGGIEVSYVSISSCREFYSFSSFCFLDLIDQGSSVSAASVVSSCRISLHMSHNGIC